MKNKKLIIYLIFLIILTTINGNNFANSPPLIYYLQLNGIINPITSQYVVNGIEEAELEGVECLILQIDTPGGLDTSMRDIIKKILNTPIPVIVYVSPSGSRAASAGVFITLASHIAVMAPGTNIGAATPVTMGEGEIDEAMKAKMVNDAAAYIKSIANSRGRNAEWAEKAVREGASITEQEAIENGTIEFIAQDIDELIQIVNGVKVNLPDGKRTLNTKNATIQSLKMNFKDLFLHSLSNPNIAYVLLFIGIYGILGEFSNPGTFFPAIVGGICLILAFISFQSIPINIGGLLLIIFGILLFIIEIYTPTFGILSAGGITALILGSFMLPQSTAPFLRISIGLIISMSLTTAGFFIFALSKGLRIQWKKPVTGKETIIGKIGIVKTALNPSGSIFIQGERWQAQSREEFIQAGEEVEVIETKGLNLVVKKVNRKE